MSTEEPELGDAGHAPDLAESAWHRLSARMIWVDLAQSLLASLPALLAIALWGVEPNAGTIWPLVGLAAVGIIGALADALRWVVTRFRVTGSHVELRTGILVRQHRSLRRDRIRSVDIEARLRHRLSGLRVVAIGAGQQAAAGEAAFRLDAVTATDARELQALLLRPVGGSQSAATAAAPTNGEAPTDEEVPTDSTARPRETEPTGSAAEPALGAPLEVFARFRARWVVHNMFTVWAYVLALGLGWGGLWLLESLGVGLVSTVAGLLDWGSLGWVDTAVIAFVAVTALGVVGLAVNYVIEFWNFELARVRGREDGTMLRTRKGLFTTREVNRDEDRIRGVEISQPLAWRWLGVTDTWVITTGLDEWSMSDPAAILPRTPLPVARRVASDVLGGDVDLFRVPLTPHPRAALLRRLAFAAVLAVAPTLALGWMVFGDVLPPASLWAVALLWPVVLGGAVVAYRALGHAIAGPYLIARSGLVNRSTAVLRRSAVSTIVVRESLLQRFLGLRSVSTMTAAGYGRYDAPDLGADEALDFARQAAPGLLDPYLADPTPPS